MTTLGDLKIVESIDFEMYSKRIDEKIKLFYTQLTTVIYRKFKKFSCRGYYSV